MPHFTIRNKIQMCYNSNCCCCNNGCGFGLLNVLFGRSGSGCRYGCGNGCYDAYYAAQYNLPCCSLRGNGYNSGCDCGCSACSGTQNVTSNINAYGYNGGFTATN